MAEKTVHDEKIKKQALQLKKLLGSPKKQNLGNVENWKNIPVNYIVTASTLGIELDDYAIKRLNNAEDKDKAFQSMMIVHYFSSDAEEKGNRELAGNLRKMVSDENISTEELGIYATKAMESSFSKRKLKQRLSGIEKKIKEGGFEENVMDVVLFPTDREKAYVHLSNVPESLDNLIVNIYSKDKMANDLADDTLKVAEQEIKSKLGVEIEGLELKKKSSKKWSYIWGGAALAAIAFTLESKIFHVGGALSVIFSSLAIGYGTSWRDKSKELKGLIGREDGLKGKFSVARINWVHDKDLENAYNHAYGQKPLPKKEIDNDAVRKAMLNWVTGGWANNFTKIYSYQTEYDLDAKIKKQDLENSHYITMKGDKDGND
ncbi:MAG: hypothetical protein ABIB71_08880 [Candidatus Woesearchaeota archaeon]